MEVKSTTLKPKDVKRVLEKEILKNRDEVMFTDLLYTANHFPSGDLIDGVDVVHPFTPLRSPLRALCRGMGIDLRR